MGFFLETLLGGLMAGMLYALVALGFVLIFKASGVFNFAQGAMVLFGALAMARFAEWIPGWTGIDSKLLANVAAFVVAKFGIIPVAGVAINLAPNPHTRSTVIAILRFGAAMLLGVAASNVLVVL